MGGNHSSQKRKSNENPGIDVDEPKTPLPADLQDIQRSKLEALLDPRSPTIGVSRTPVEVIAEREKNRLERERKLQALGDKNTLQVPNSAAPAAADTPSGFFDPRSPTFEYKRTPIAIGNMDEEGEPMDVESTPIKTEIQLPTNPPSAQVCRDLRKRLFVAQMNDSLNASGIQDENNKEN